MQPAPKHLPISAAELGAGLVLMGGLQVKCLATIRERGMAMAASSGLEVWL